MSFPERLSTLQKERGLEKQDIYKALGLSQTTYWRYELGKREPTISVLAALADFFNVSVDYLIGRSNNPARLP
ncbi:MAG: helix-turn-helix transcriptional regulator [Selenomonadaceae bacterium]|nr:helix-turn-helix transcriptional regulator [Selenomonadaceae bacterium]